MADTSKPAAKTAAKKPTTARKKTTKRGPTKAAALKALGLTQEDLDVIKQVAEARKRAQEQPVQSFQADPQPTTVVQESPPAPVERVVPTEENGPWYVRNATYNQVGFRLERQQGPGKKRTELTPRGTRGDIKKLEKGDLEDADLQRQVAYGVVHIISAAEAKDIISKQGINQQQAMHPAMAVLRNELGQAYGTTDAQGVFHQQQNIPVVGDNSYTVAHLTPQGGEAGAIPDQGRGVDWNAVRQGAPAGTLGGNPAIISDGFARPDAAVQADAVARTKGLQGPEAGLGGIQTVVIEAPQQG